MINKTFFILIIALLFFSLLAQVSIARADKLIIQDNGKMILIITSNGILGLSTAPIAEKTTAPVPQANSSQQQNTSPPPASSTPQTPPKTVPLVPSHTESTVQINPPINNDKKVQVTITTQATVAQIPSSAGSIKVPVTTSTTQNIKHISQNVTRPPTKSSATITASPISNSQQPAPTQINNTTSAVSNAPPSILTKTVDQVVAQGSKGQPVITIKSNQTNQLTIQQGSTQVTTSLPLQIDTLTHLLSIPAQNQSATINVLPSEALQGIINKGLLDTQSANQAQINLTKDTNGINYTVNTQKQGKLFGLFPVKSPLQVKLSVQNGKIVNVAQSVLFSIFGGFIK